MSHGFGECILLNTVIGPCCNDTDDKMIMPKSLFNLPCLHWLKRVHISATLSREWLWDLLSSSDSRIIATVSLASLTSDLYTLKRNLPVWVHKISSLHGKVIFLCEMLLMHKMHNECTCVAHLYHGTANLGLLCVSFSKYVSLMLMYQMLSFESPLTMKPAGCLRYEVIMSGLWDTFFYFSTPALGPIFSISSDDFLWSCSKEKYSACGESHHSST